MEKQIVLNSQIQENLQIILVLIIQFIIHH